VTHTVESEKAATTVTGEQLEENKFTIAGQVVKCKKANFAATIGLKQTEVTGIAPTYAECTYGANPATVTMKGCTYSINGLTDANGDALTKVVCTGTNHITIDIPAIHCEITVKEAAAVNGSQTATGGVKLTNAGATTTRDITLDLTATVKVSRDFKPEKEGEGEPAACSSAQGTGKLTGSVTTTGSVSGAHVGIFFV
jgi:hypothetical protein